MIAPSKIEPAKRSLGSAFRTFKKIMDSEKSGENSIKEVQALAQRRAQIAEKYDAVLAEFRKVQDEASEARRDFEQNPTTAGVRRLVAALPQAEVAIEIFAALSK